MGREISSDEILCEDTFQSRLRSETSLVMQGSRRTPSTRLTRLSVGWSLKPG